VLAHLERRGQVQRELRGRRCYRIGAVTACQELTSDADIAAAAGITERTLRERYPADELEEQPPLVVAEEHALHDPPERVTITAEVDPAMARAVFDLIEHGRRTQLIDRDETVRMVERAVNRQTARSGDATMRMVHRIEELERQLAEVQSAMRHLGVAPVATNGHKAKPRVNFRMLGVKDSAQRKLLADMAADGWQLEKGRSGHVRATKDGHKPIELSTTPSDHRTPLNDRARARAAGANV
jgi:hypothetical protein